MTVRYGAYLPHWTAPDSTYHVVFRLADSLPAEVMQRLRLLADSHLERKHPASAPDAPTPNEDADIDAFLDSGAGACWLSRPEVAGMVVSAIRHFDDARYRLYAWCVMPNHVHVVASWRDGESVSETLQSWKSFTAKRANVLLGRTGSFWQKESYDHLVRDDGELARTIAYVRQNPQKAGLVDWPWVWADETQICGETPQPR